MNTMRKLLFALVVLPGVALATTANDESVRKEIAAPSRAFSDALVRNDMAALGEAYTDDAVVLPPGSVVRGREKIREFFAGKPGRQQLAHEMATDELRLYGAVAVDSGTWRSTVKRGDQEPVTDSERYLAVWHRGGDGRWRMAFDMWHRPPIQAPPVKDPPPASIVLPAELERVLRDYEKAWKARDAAALAALFAADGYVLPSGRPPVVGRGAVEQYYRGSGGPLALRAFHYRVSGDTGFILGGYAGSASDPDDGKFTLTLRREESGRWMIVSDMDNGNRPR